MRHQGASKLVIFGTGRGGSTALRYFLSDSQHEVAAFIVDRKFMDGDTFAGHPVCALDEIVDRYPPSEVKAFVALGAARMNGSRRDKYAQLRSLGYSFVSYVHSSNSLEGRCNVGENCFILENQVVNFETSIGNNVVMWAGSHIGDRSSINDHVHLGAHVVINGDVTIGEGAYLGSNCTISHSVTVGAYSFIGANALISSNTSERAVHVVEPTPAAEIDSMRFMRLMRTSV